jgi:NADPH2:quinone reductase
MLKEQLKPLGVDLAIDNIGGDLFPRVIDTLAMQGRVSVVGQLAGPVPKFATATLFFRRLRVGGVAVGTYTPAESQAAWKALLAVLEGAKAKPIVDSVFPMERLQEAFARLKQGPMGKVLVQVGRDA